MCGIVLIMKIGERERERMKRAMIELLRWNACGAFLVVVLSNYSNANYWLLEIAINMYDV